MKRVLLTTATALALWAQTRAQTAETYSYSVKQCIDYAFANSSKVKNAQLDQEIADAKVKEIRGLGLPQVNGSIDVKDYIDLPTSLIPASAFNPLAPANYYIPAKFGLKYNSTAGLDASQILFDGTYFLGLKATLVYKELSKVSATRTKQETAIAVTKAYYGVLVNEERLGLLDANVTRLKKLVDDTKAMYDNGLVEKLDFDRASLSYSTVAAEQKKVQQYVAVSYLMLKFQMGMPLYTELKITDKLADFTQLSNNVAVEKIDYNKRPEYSLAKTQNELNRMDLKKNKLAMAPSLVAYGNLSAVKYNNSFAQALNTGPSDANDASTRWYPITIIGAKLTVPIWGSGQRYYRIQQARLSYEKSTNDVKNLELGIDLEVKSASTNYLNNTATLETQKGNLSLAESVYNTTKIKYDQGVGSNLEVITAETSLKEAQTNYYSALYDALISKVDLDKATGNIKY